MQHGREGEVAHGESGEKDERINKHSGLKNKKVFLERPDVT